jgi:hypothetical protein
LSGSPNFQLSSYEICHFSLIVLQKQKTQKLTKTLENNKAKGLTSVIQGVQIHNIWHSSSTPEEIHNEAVVHFADFLGRRASASVLSLSDVIQEEVREAENLNLCRSPTKQEIKDALFDIPINSSPGPDGFTSGFFQHCWDFIQTDLVEAVMNFFAGTAFPRYYTASFLVLIPKVSDPCSFDKFRPISLCLVVYKICSKLIVNRLYAVLCRLVFEE